LHWALADSITCAQVEALERELQLVQEAQARDKPAVSAQTASACSGAERWRWRAG
jgi:hypothetical protein